MTSVAEPEPPGADVFRAAPESEPTYFGRSWSRLRDLGLPEPVPELPRKKTCIRHWYLGVEYVEYWYISVIKYDWLNIKYGAGGAGQVCQRGADEDPQLSPPDSAGD